MFPGAAVVVSHDRWFLDRVATHLFYVDGKGGVRLHHGDLSGLLTEITAEREADRLAEQRARRESSQKAAQPTPKEAPTRKRLTPWQEKELVEVEAEISRLEERLTELDESLGSADLYAPGADPDRPRALTAERDAAQSRLDEVFARWEELEDLRG